MKGEDLGTLSLFNLEGDGARADLRVTRGSDEGSIYNQLLPLIQDVRSLQQPSCLVARSSHCSLYAERKSTVFVLLPIDTDLEHTRPE